VSQFGHMFAPRPEVTIAEMLRVLKPGGTIAFSTWPPEHFVGRMFALVGKHLPPPPQRGDPNIVRQRLGDAAATVDTGQNDGGSVRFSTQAGWSLVQVWNLTSSVGPRRKGCFYFPAPPPA
jgi:SAM-dependent methyltransferase